MIYGGVLKGMTEDELRNYVKQLTRFLEKQSSVVSAEISRANAYRDLASAIEYERDASRSADYERNQLKKLEAEYEEKYKELLPPTMAEETYKPV